MGNILNFMVLNLSCYCIYCTLIQSSFLVIMWISLHHTPHNLPKIISIFISYTCILWVTVVRRDIFSISVDPSPPEINQYLHP